MLFLVKEVMKLWTGLQLLSLKLKTEYDPLPSKLTAILQAKVTCNKSDQSLQSGSIKNRLQLQFLIKKDMQLAAGEKI